MDRMGNRDETQDGHYTHMFWKDGKKGLSKTTELLKEEIKIYPYKRKILSICVNIQTVDGRMNRW